MMSMSISESLLYMAESFDGGRSNRDQRWIDALRNVAALCSQIGDQAAREKLRKELTPHQHDPEYQDRWSAYQYVCYWMDH